MLTRLSTQATKLSLSSSSSFLSSRQINPLKFFSTSSMSASSRPVQDSIEKNLASLDPVFMKVVNESHMHNVPKGSESHFKVTVVSPTFTDLKLIQRHKLINACLKAELAGPVHALSIVAKDPKQFEDMGNVIEDMKSPSCKGGDGSLPPKN